MRGKNKRFVQYKGCGLLAFLRCLMCGVIINKHLIKDTLSQETPLHLKFFSNKILQCTRNTLAKVKRILYFTYQLTLLK